LKHKPSGVTEETPLDASCN